ncbi:hypothetical protein [Singulisphaera sp. PoT]|uniref:hypothetical protein n=1 Tax=Singulisphaera sp. PoT TaxID=3411797 RepID=UPI003BF61435
MLPQLVLLVLLALRVGALAGIHGKSFEAGKVNVRPSIGRYAIFIGLLYWGGFFSNVLEQLYK